MLSILADINDYSTPATALGMTGVVFFVLKYMVSAMDKQREGYVQFTRELKDFMTLELSKHGDSVHDLAKIQCMLLMKITEPGTAAHLTASKELDKLERK